MQEFSIQRHLVKHMMATKAFEGRWQPRKQVWNTEKKWHIQRRIQECLSRINQQPYQLLSSTASQAYVFMEQRQQECIQGSQCDRPRGSRLKSMQGGGAP